MKSRAANSLASALVPTLDHFSGSVHGMGQIVRDGWKAIRSRLAETIPGWMKDVEGRIRLASEDLRHWRVRGS